MYLCIAYKPGKVFGIRLNTRPFRDRYALKCISRNEAPDRAEGSLPERQDHPGCLIGLMVFGKVLSIAEHTI